MKTSVPSSSPPPCPPCKTPPNSPLPTGSTPVCATSDLPQFFERKAEQAAEDWQGPPELFNFRPLSVPSPIPSRRLSRGDLRHLVGVLDLEIGRMGTDQESGRRLVELRDKLMAIHRIGFEHDAR